MVEETLKEINKWYNEPMEGTDRSNLLSKLALLELCGWIEGDFDRIVRAAAAQTLRDNWVEGNVIDKTFGFGYSEHFRPMICRLFGEHIIRKLETEIENEHPGDLENLKSKLGDLWKKRCKVAHTDLGAMPWSQTNIQGPSWSLNQYRALASLIQRFELLFMRAVRVL